MRKVLYTLAGLCSLAVFASCNKEAMLLAPEEGEVVTATFTVASPDAVATRAISDGASSTSLIVAVYDEQGKYLSNLSSGGAGCTVTGTGTPWNVQMKLVKDMTYQFVFVANNDNTNGFSRFNPADSTITIHYDALNANDDKADFFYVKDKFKVEGSFSKSVELRRPLAQVNFGASDLTEAAYSINTATMQTGVTLTGIYSAMKVLSGDVTGDAAAQTFALDTRVTEDAQFVEGFDRIAMVYALVAPSQDNVTATLSVSATGILNAEPHDITCEVANVPLKRNFRTNILGNLFTSDAEFNVYTEPGFYNPDNVKAYHWSFASVAALNEFFANFSGYDAGDVDPELVTLTAFGASETSSTIYLPKSVKTITISVPVDAADKTITLEYAAGATDGEKPDVDFFASNLGELIADITDSHLTILTGSVISEGEFATGSETLEIEEGAKVGTATISQGNAEIAGEVDAVEVAADATSDGEGAAVQVFVAKEAAIQTITLNAKTDVIVEQPKDNIDVETTDNKVVVVVNAAGSSATAQNGGQIYVQANASCVVTATNDEEMTEAENTSSVYVAEVNNSAVVAAVEDNGGDVSANEDTSKVPDDAVVEGGVASVNNTAFFDSVQDAIASAVDGDVIKLLKDYDARGMSTSDMYDSYRIYNISKSITFDGNGHTLIAKGRGFAVGATATSNVDVTFKNINILNTSASARCIDTRGHIGTLTLDGVKLSTDGASGGYTQPLTIGGNQSSIATVNITNSTIETNIEGTATYYAIITFNPVNMSISNSTIKGWACIYAKGPDTSAGSNGSVFNIDKCEIVSANHNSGTSNAFAAFAVETPKANNVVINVTNSDLNISALGNQPQFIASGYNSGVLAQGGVTLGEGNTVTLIGYGAFNNLYYSGYSPALSITGGVYNSNPSAYVADGYEVVDNDDESHPYKVVAAE